jgi:glycosidase
MPTGACCAEEKRLRPKFRALALIGLLLAGGCRTLPPAAPAPEAAGAPEAAQAPAGTPWWQERVFYEVFVRSFADSASGPLANDGIGDFQGLIERLDYLNDGDPATNSDLGVTGIWLMPINPSPSYHGYDVTDYYGVNPEYGTREDFQRFMKACHQRGIRVIVDLVLNHSSSQHPWFLRALAGDPEYRDRYIFAAPADVPDVRGPWDQRVWQVKDGQHYYGIFWSGMPDLNYRNPEVTAEAKRVAEHWLGEMGVDGFRLDAIRHLLEDGELMSDTPGTFAWLEDYQRHLKRVRPDVLTVGEVWTHTETVSEYIRRDTLDLAFEFDLAAAILKAAQGGRKDELAYALENAATSYPPNRFATMITNHDQDRVASVLREDLPRMKLAASLLLTAPGVPFVYYGEEIGQVGAKPDEMIRNPMPWTAGPNGGFTTAARPWEPLQPGHERRNVAVQDADPDSLLNHYRRLIRLRQVEPALARGEFRSLDTGRDDVVAWERTADGRRLLVLTNLSGDEIADYRLPGASLRLSAELLHGAAAGDSTALDLAARTTYVYVVSN